MQRRVLVGSIAVSLGALALLALGVLPGDIALPLSRLMLVPAVYVALHVAREREALKRRIRRESGGRPRAEPIWRSPNFQFIAAFAVGSAVVIALNVV